MKKIGFSKLPESISVNVKKGESGCLLAELPEYDVFTEADDLNHLYFQVNDLIYTYFDVPKKYQDKISFIPPLSARHELIKIAEQKPEGNESKFKVSTSYTPEFYRNVVNF